MNDDENSENIRILFMASLAVALALSVFALVVKVTLGWPS